MYEEIEYFISKLNGERNRTLTVYAVLVYNMSE